MRVTTDGTVVVLRRGGVRLALDAVRVPPRPEREDDRPRPSGLPATK